MGTVVTIGGVTYDVPPVNLKAIRAIWPVVKEAQGVQDPLDAIHHAVTIVAIALLFKEDRTLGGDETEKAIAAKVGFVEENMVSTEIPGLRIVMREILVDSGLLVKQGEPEGDAPAPQSSTETSTA